MIWWIQIYPVSVWWASQGKKRGRWSYAPHLPTVQACQGSILWQKLNKMIPQRMCATIKAKARPAKHYKGDSFYIHTYMQHIQRICNNSVLHWQSVTVNQIIFWRLGRWYFIITILFYFLGFYIKIHILFSVEWIYIAVIQHSRTSVATCISNKTIQQQFLLRHIINH